MNKFSLVLAVVLSGSTLAPAKDYFLSSFKKMQLSDKFWCEGATFGDFNHDGHPDLAVANSGSNDVSILLGNGDGTFQGPLTFAAGSSPRSVAVGDFNGDGSPDLAVVSPDADVVSVLLGSGNGTFQNPVSFAVGSSPQSVVVSDLNRDGFADLIVANGGSADVSVLLDRKSVV